MDYGFFTGDDWTSHAWVEVADIVVDITADQFGHAPVTITSVQDPAYRASKDQRYQLRPTPAAMAAVDEIWPLWREKEGVMISGMSE